MTDELLHLIASVIAWSEGSDDPKEEGKTTLYQDSAQQCAEELGLA